MGSFDCGRQGGRVQTRISYSFFSATVPFLHIFKWQELNLSSSHSAEQFSVHV